MVINIFTPKKILLPCFTCGILIEVSALQFETNQLISHVTGHQLKPRSHWWCQSLDQIWTVVRGQTGTAAIQHQSGMQR